MSAVSANMILRHKLEIEASMWVKLDAASDGLLRETLRETTGSLVSTEVAVKRSGLGGNHGGAPYPRSGRPPASDREIAEGMEPKGFGEGGCRI